MVDGGMTWQLGQPKDLEHQIMPQKRWKVESGEVACQLGGALLETILVAEEKEIRRLGVLCWWTSRRDRLTASLLAAS